MNVIEVNGLTKDYGNHKGVFDVSFAVEKGEVMGFLGPNGAGKTTTIRQLMGFIRPDKGTARVEGQDCFTSAALIQRDLGYLPGEIAFMDDMTGMAFIRFIAGMKGIKNMQRAEELMQFFELDASGRIKKMSKGMKQKIGIVCAFMQDPAVYVLDEPTSGLDPLMQGKFIELIQQEKKRGKTILMSSHMFDEVERTCDRTAIIRAGSLVGVESMDALRRKKRRTYQITFASPEQTAQFAAAHKGVQAHSETTVTTSISGAVDGLIKALAHYEVHDLQMKAETLEELFMHYYDKEAKA